MILTRLRTGKGPKFPFRLFAITWILSIVPASAAMTLPEWAAEQLERDAAVTAAHAKNLPINLPRPKHPYTRFTDEQEKSLRARMIVDNYQRMKRLPVFLGAAGVIHTGWLVRHKIFKPNMPLAKGCLILGATVTAYGAPVAASWWITHVWAKERVAQDEVEGTTTASTAAPTPKSSVGNESTALRFARCVHGNPWWFLAVGPVVFSLLSFAGFRAHRTLKVRGRLDLEHRALRPVSYFVCPAVAVAHISASYWASGQVPRDEAGNVIKPKVTLPRRLPPSQLRPITTPTNDAAAKTNLDLATMERSARASSATDMSPPADIAEIPKDNEKQTLLRRFFLLACGDRILWHTHLRPPKVSQQVHLFGVRSGIFHWPLLAAGGYIWLYWKETEAEREAGQMPAFQESLASEFVKDLATSQFAQWLPMSDYSSHLLRCWQASFRTLQIPLGGCQCRDIILHLDGLLSVW